MRRSVLVTLLAFSLAVNAATAGSLIFFWARAHANVPEILLGQKPMKKFLKEDLGLTPDQLSKIMELINEKRPDIVELNRRFVQTRNEMKSSVTADKIDMAALHRRAFSVLLTAGFNPHISKKDLTPFLLSKTAVIN